MITTRKMHWRRTRPRQMMLQVTPDRYGIVERGAYGWWWAAYENGIERAGWCPYQLEAKAAAEDALGFERDEPK